MIKGNAVATVDSLAPNSPESEEATLGVVLVDPERFERLAAIVRHDDFFLLRNSLIWRALQDLQQRGDDITLVSVTHELRQRGELDNIGGIAYLGYLINNAPLTPGYEVFGRIVARVATRRRILQAANEIAQTANSPDVDLDGVVVKAHEILRDATRRNDRSTISKMVDVIGELDSEISRRESLVDTGESVGLPSGFATVDKMSGGWMPGELIEVAARPRHGKTTWIMNVMRNLARKNIPFGFFSLEMTRMSIGFRWLAMETGLNTQIFKQPSSLINPQNQRLIAEANARIKTWPGMIETTPRITASDFARKAAVMVGEGAKVIFIDYAQQMGSEFIKDARTKQYRRPQNTRETVNHNIQTLKEVAKKYNIVVVAAVQLSREYFRSSDLTPDTNMLKESDNLLSETDALYFINTRCMEKGQEPMPDTAKGKAALTILSCGKMRDGAQHGDIAFDFFLHNQRFAERGPVATVNVQDAFMEFTGGKY